MDLVVAQGAGEERTEVYMKYSEGVLQPATQRYTKSFTARPALPGGR